MHCNCSFANDIIHHAATAAPSLHCCPLLLSLPLLIRFLCCHKMLSPYPRQLTRDLQKREPRHPKRPQLPPGEARTPTKRIVHTVVYKRKKLSTLKLYELYLKQLLTEQAAELDKIVKVVNVLGNHFTPPSKLTKFKSYRYNASNLSPLSVQIPPHNIANCFHCYPQGRSHLPRNY